MTDKTYVLYHANCTDGTGSKYAAWVLFQDKAEYIPVQYGKPVPEMDPGSKIYIVDFSYPKDVLEQLRSVHKLVMVLDPHKTAQADLEGVKDCVFDMTKSGCVMTWEYFHKNEKVPELLLDIQDRDLWKFKRKNSKAVHAGLKLLRNQMSEWDLAATDSGHYVNLVVKGETLLEAQDLQVESYVKNKIKIINFQGYKVGITNATDLASEIGNAICLDKKLGVDFALIYCITSDNEVLCSLRSDGDMDVSAIAKKFGGGGHKNASGFVISIGTLSKLLDNLL